MDVDVVEFGGVGGGGGGTKVFVEVFEAEGGVTEVWVVSGGGGVFGVDYCADSVEKH